MEDSDDQRAHIDAPEAWSSGFDAWRDGDLLVVRANAALPDRCVMTNEPAIGHLITRLYWHRPAYYWTLLAGPGLYMIMRYILGSSVELTIGLSRPVLRRRRIVIAAAWTVFAVGTLMTSIGSAVNAGGMPALGYTLILVAALGWAFGTRHVHAVRIQSGYAWVKGAHHGYLASLPAWDGRIEGSPYKLIEQNARR